MPALGATVSVEVAVPSAVRFTEPELKVQVAFVGQPATESETEPIKLFSEVNVNTELPV